MGPLDDITVVEIGTLVAGPFCGQMLGDLGARVIKVEEPGKGDPMRVWGRGKVVDDRSLWWPVIGRNKESVTINLRTPQGQAALRRLIATADVLVENFRAGTLERWDLAPETLQADNPGLIVVRVTGFGQTGPYAAQAGFGAVGEAMGGLRYITGDPMTPPSRTGISIGDTLAGTMGALGALTALHERTRSSRGQVIDVAIYEAVLAYMESLIPEFAIGGLTRERTGGILPNVAPSNVYPTVSGRYVLIAANRDTVFERLCVAMGDPALATHARYATHAARGENQAELDNLIAGWTATRDEGEILAQMEEHGVPAGRIYTAEDMIADEHFQARQSIVSVKDPEIGEIPMQSVFPRLSRTPGSIRWPGPLLGEHNEAVLGRLLGFSRKEIQNIQQ